MNSKQAKSALRGVFGLMAFFAMWVVAASPVLAITAGSGASVQGYAADSPIDNGTIVRLTGEEANRVEPAQQSDVQNMFGVAVDRNQLPITITNSAIQNETFVAVSGTYNVLVSTQGGEIQSGDYVTLSSINGVAMRAGTEKVTVFGRANGSFDGKGVTLGSATIKDVNGNDTGTVILGSVPVTIDIRNNPNDISTKVKVPDLLERIGQAIAEREVSPIRIYLSLGITVVSVATAIAIVYSGVRNGVVSIGRNPMSKKSIFRALVEIIITSFLILIIGLFAVYLLLRL